MTVNGEQIRVLWRSIRREGRSLRLRTSGKPGMLLESESAYLSLAEPPSQQALSALKQGNVIHL